jgi:membrane-bound lytic murein transglycosylase B
MLSQNKLTQLLVVFFISVLSPNMVHADYSKNINALKLVDELVKEHDFDRASLLSLLAEAERKEGILEAIAKPAEKRLEWFEYRRIFITKDRIEKGRAFIKQYLKVLEKAEDQFGVPKEIITAIIGVETRYGIHKGKYRVLDALTTLGFDYPPRAKFFSSELKHAFLLAKEQGFDMREIKGSYAGAMGYGQFIPSSYRHYAIDFDGDNVANILDNPVDAIGSVANYFSMHHWKKGEAIAFLLFEHELDAIAQKYTSKSLKPSFTLDQMRKSGLPIPNQLAAEDFGKIQHYQLENGEQNWLTLHNFYVITRYNHSHLYAMAVFDLAKALGLDK